MIIFNSLHIQYFSRYFGDNPFWEALLGHLENQKSKYRIHALFIEIESGNFICNIKGGNYPLNHEY